MNEQEKRPADSVVCFGACQLDVKLVQVWRDHHEVKLTGKAFAVLCYFVDHPGQLVTKDDLFAAAWPETVISDATLASCIQEVRQALGDDAKKPRYIETVHRRGFRFIAPLTTTPPVVSDQLSVVSSQEEENQKAKGKNQKAKAEEIKQEIEKVGNLDEAQRNPGEALEWEEASHMRSAPTLDLRPQTPETSVAPASPRLLRSVVLAAVLLLTVTILLVQYLSRSSLNPQPSVLVPEEARPPLSLPDKPSIIVLPLVNLSNEPEQEYFSDGLTGEITSRLSRINGLFVIARTSAFTYKGKAAKVQDIGHEMGVQYVLEGSVRKANEQIRINIQLIDTVSGGHIWAERYERPLTDIFALQDEIAQKIMFALKVKLTKEEQERFRRYPTENLEAYDALLRGAEAVYGFTKESNAQGRQFFEKAIALDSQYAGAYGWLGWTYWNDYLFHNRQDPQDFERVLELTQRAIALDSSLPDAPALLSLLYLEKQQPEQALAEAERAIALDPNFADSYAVLADILSTIGRPEEAIEAAKKALRLNPRGPEAILYLDGLGRAYHLTDRYAESIAVFRQLLARNPNFLSAHLQQVFNYVSLWGLQLSHDPYTLDQASDAAQTAVTLNAAFPWVRAALGTVYLWQKQHDDAIAELERAVALDENFVCGQMLFAFGLSQVGRAQEAVQVGERALSLKALPSDDRCLFGVAAAYALAGRGEEAMALYLRMLKQFPNFLGPHLGLAAIYSELGRETEAQAAAVEVLRINPQFSLEVHKQRVPLKDPAVLERHIAALRKAGLK
jgi:TolB-like protein/DNA-binding winged helix-turn-helix (wHTH) protein/Tfp pilus assembly protein PilF